MRTTDTEQQEEEKKLGCLGSGILCKDRRKVVRGRGKGEDNLKSAE